MRRLCLALSRITFPDTRGDGTPIAKTKVYCQQKKEHIPNDLHLRVTLNCNTQVTEVNTQVNCHKTNLHFTLHDTSL